MKATYKNRFRRLLILAVAVAAVLSLSVGAAAEDFRALIPSRLADADVPEIPEPLALDTWTDSVATHGNRQRPADPCPILATDNAIMHLQFAEQPDWATAYWARGSEAIDVDTDGYAELRTEGRIYQAGYSWGGENAFFIAASKADVAAGYMNNGDVAYIEYTVEGDFFGTGIEGAVTVFRYEPITIDGDHYVYVRNPDGTTSRVNLRGTLDENGDELHWYYTNWYVPSVKTIYPDGSGLVSIEAEYWNNRKATLRRYTVRYSPAGSYVCARKVSITKKPSDPVTRNDLTQRVSADTTIYVTVK